MQGGFYLALGQQGSGKSALITKFLADNKDKYNGRIFSNYTLFDIDYIPTTFDPQIERDKDKLDILEKLKEDPTYFNNSIMTFDEIHIYFDSRDFMKENHRIVQTFFSQLRKRNILLLATSQARLDIDIKLRRQCLNIFYMEQIGHDPNFDGDIFVVETHAVTGQGYFTELKSKYKLNLQPYFKYYDTNEIIE